MISRPVFSRYNFCVTFIGGLLALVLEVLKLLIGNESIVLSPHHFVRQGQIKQTSWVAVGVLTVYLLNSNYCELIFKPCDFSFVLHLLPNNDLGWIVHNYFRVVKCNPRLSQLFEFIIVLLRLPLLSVFISKLLLNLSELLIQSSSFLDCLSPCLVIGVCRHSRFFELLLLQLEVCSEPVGVPCVLIAWWCLLVEVSSYIDIFDA